MAIYDVTKPEFKSNIQLAINKCKSEGGGTVYIPHGSYDLPDTLRVDSPMTILGDGLWSSTLRGPVGKESLVVDAGTDLRGVVLNNFCVAPRDHNEKAIVIRKGWGVSISNIVINSPGVGLYVTDSGPTDVMNLYVNNARHAGVSINNCGSDIFFSKVHVNNGTPADTPDKIDWSDPKNWPNPNAKGLELNNASGAHFTDCDFIGGLIGVYVVGSIGSDWLKFVSVSADTVFQDAWHIVEAKGLQMTGCWSGTFMQGTGIWIGPKVTQMSIVNHQWQNGLFGVGNNSDSVVILGGIMSVQKPISSTKPGWPKQLNILGVPEKLALQAHDRTHFVTATSGGGGNVAADKSAIGDWETFEVIRLL